MNKNLLVIGGSSDMGMACIRRLADRYERVVAHYRRMSDELEALQRELGDKLICLQADLSEEAQVRGLIQSIRDANIAPYHIVHFPAPLRENQRFPKIDWATFQIELDVSVKSLVLILQAFLPAMAKERTGRIVLMLSSVVHGAPPSFCANYVTTKYALLGLMKALSVEYAGKGITVNGVSPAWVETKFNANQPHVIAELNAQESPIGRNLIANDVVPAIEYLLSDGADCVNGQNLIINGGR